MNLLADNLKTFINRVCTVLTGATGLHISDPVKHAQFFTGRVISVDNYGIWLEHLQTKTLSFFMFPIAGIVEEQFIPESDPRSTKIKEEMEKKKKPPLPSPSSQFIPIDQLTKVVKDGKNKV
jgi:hypothetical protein